MPTYEYVCDRCGHVFESFQRMSEKPLTRCPKCAGNVRRLISAGAGVIVREASSVVNHAGSTAASESCDRARPCCGRDTPCERKPCEA